MGSRSLGYSHTQGDVHNPDHKARKDTGLSPLCLKKASPRGQNTFPSRGGKPKPCSVLWMEAGGLSAPVVATPLPDLLLFLKFTAFLAATGDRTMVFVKKITSVQGAEGRLSKTCHQAVPEAPE